MHFSGKFLAAFLATTTLASAWCHDSATCAVGGSGACDLVCKRQGNDNGGRCLPRDGCPGNTICACYPKGKRGVEVEIEDTEEEFFKAVSEMGARDAAAKLETRDGVDKRSVCCSLMPPANGFCCEAHCDYIGKQGGQCSGGSGEGVCECN